MYEIAVWEDTVIKSGRDIMFAINIPQEAIVIPENIDGIRAALHMHETADEAREATNKYLGMKAR